MRISLAAVTAAVLSTTLLSACGGGDSGDSGKSANGLEKTKINVAGLAVVDDAALYIARDKGLFKAEGLNVNVTTLTQSTQAIPGLLRGSIDMKSEPGKGSTITLRIPLTLAIIEGLLVRVGSARYIIPLACVEECVELATDWISTHAARDPVGAE